ncbi:MULTISPECIES: ATP-binding protein [Rhizobium]|uniref:ATP-binding protein n=1 Tax=Rhizobium TaxID=379 RepID=UPI0013EEFD1C|nr:MULTISPECIES: ATP-binding protein [Rhizobium]MBY3492558.1 ATP-binding protein [Rhizobium laguerreae]
MSGGNQQFDFLAPAPAQIRHQIKGILDSYSHEWDLLAELCQNAVDAIRLRQESHPDKGHIRIAIDAAAHKITVSDNGTGIAAPSVPLLLRPFATNKVGNPKQVGSKGVGIAFVIFSSSRFEITTNDGTDGLKATIVDAAHWIEATTHDNPTATSELLSPGTPGTTVAITVADHDHPIFKLTAHEVEYVLRTKTAVGDAGYIWEQPFDCDVELTHTTHDGVATTKEFEAQYLLPTEGLKKSDTLSLTEFGEWMSGERSDAEKRRKVKDKIITHLEWKIVANRTIRWWSCFIPTRTWWDTLNELHGLTKQSGEDEDTDSRGQGFGGGLYTSTKGMPTGIVLDVKPKGSAGYVPNFFVLIEDPGLRFDIGRKSIPGRQQGLLRQLAENDFRQYINRVQKYLAGEPDRIHGGWNKSEEFSEIRKLLELNSAATRFTRRPDTQEATVAAMFFEQIGKGKFPEITPLLSGYKKKYDLYARYNSSDTVIEFKYNLSNLINEFNDAKKMFDQVDIAVVWEVTEADFQLAGRRGLTLEREETSSFGKDKSVFHYRLDLGPVDPVFVIAMKDALGLA